MIPKFIGFFITFMIIGLYWTIHHRLFGFVMNYNLRLMWLNMFFLLAVILLPFTSAFYSEYITYFLKTPMVLYISNISFLGLMNFMMWRYVGNPKNGLSEGLSKPVADFYSIRAIIVPTIFILMAITYFIFPRFAIWMPLFIPLVMWLLARTYRKKINFIIKK